jgi:hypothetical protein
LFLLNTIGGLQLRRGGRALRTCGERSSIHNCFVRYTVEGPKFLVRGPYLRPQSLCEHHCARDHERDLGCRKQQIRKENMLRQLCHNGEAICIGWSRGTSLLTSSNRQDNRYIAQFREEKYDVSLYISVRKSYLMLNFCFAAS